MATATVLLKRWGSSLGVIIPAELVENEGLFEMEKVVIEVRKTTTLADMFGSLKDWKTSSQKIKDEAREQW